MAFYKTLLTEAERAVIDALVSAWNEYVELPIMDINGRDREEFMYKIHDLQRMVLSRPVERILKEEHDKETYNKN